MRNPREKTRFTEYVYIYTNWWYTYPSEKYESQLGLVFPIYGKIKMFQTTNQYIYIHVNVDQD
jgi:hypothetical protein